MKSRLVLIKYCLLILLICTKFSLVLPQQSLKELKEKIDSNTFPNEIFENYEFCIVNNKFDFDREIQFLSTLKSSFETEFLQSLILFKKK